ncbi:hypothetical protein A3I95_00630 [Candidatus Nomurabacteria bacterium RIFCSPLOWO2_02_FULL_44_12]|uniref:TrbC/VIRB2 family protein n=1 Tax=Candidatus Nomurabacteria bacterium RIFCSPLOWO2_12_FULL_44_11 TaxID=1801796 RepID=A0A1F6Y807_9BACT|nr:MAG: hypothetical protein A3E95_01745 [Candidatus Nomurabacteria bacterium RIFCSPHIGHO2_12_FULL_44_22b]OGJ02476.1 MAG: hypothetical protein A3G53_01100 [Candidatus Nomurabacteria bacterium RIFCSPLOWO2_12_FULL_44_11]OGJ07311.1 MAG: hypothetical protein A3I95_00630 [Candidatus Nomurabacteria bacterium RIFCSPLOWO2_02_FULL_44_12]
MKLGSKINRIARIVTFFFLSLFSAPFTILAQAITPTPLDSRGVLLNPISSNTVQELIAKLLEGIVRIGLPIVALAIIYSGFLFVAARGNSEKLTKAKSALLYTIIGAAILLGSWALAKLITETVNAL